jgi:hypothetical protein
MNTQHPEESGTDNIVKTTVKDTAYRRTFDYPKRSLCCFHIQKINRLQLQIKQLRQQVRETANQIFRYIALWVFNKPFKILVSSRQYDKLTSNQRGRQNGIEG